MHIKEEEGVMSNCYIWGGGERDFYQNYTILGINIISYKIGGRIV